MNEAKRIYLHALTAVHSGTGQGSDVIDLPIAREKATDWPVLPASGLKGAIRNAISDTPEGVPWTDRAFGKGGKGTADEEMTAGQICLTDLRILCLPVRSFFGTFAYATCPLALQRHGTSARAMGAGATETASGSVTGSHVLTTSGSALVQPGKKTVYLEDLDLEATEDPTADGTAAELAEILFRTDAEKAAFVTRFAIVSDEVFTFLSGTATEVAARVSLEKETKTVTRGGLWYEEAVPAEAIFCGLALLASHAKRTEAVTLEELGAKLGEIGVVQIGGKSSVGRGLCRVVVA